MEKKGLTVKIRTFFKEVRQETRKVNWPTKKEATRYTFIVIGISVVVAAILGGIDFVFVSILRNIVL